MPGAPSLRVRRHASVSQSRSIRWCSENSAWPRLLLARSAIHCRFVDRFAGSSVPSRVARQWFSSRDASLPSAGSRWAQFPGVSSTMKALRLPVPHGPGAHGVRDRAPRLSPRSCSRRSAPTRLEKPRRPGHIGHPAVLSAGYSSRGRIRGLPGSLAVLPMPLPSSRTPDGPALASHSARLVLSPQRRKRGLRRLERFRGLPLGFSTRCLRFKSSVARPLQDSLPAGWLAFAGRASIPLNRFNRFQINQSHDLPPLQGLPWRYLAALGMTGSLSRALRASIGI